MRNNPSDSVDGFLGYANQIYRGLGYLIDKLSTVLIEKDDDVVVSDDYGYLFLEQVKEKEKVIFRVGSLQTLWLFAFALYKKGAVCLFAAH